MTANGAAGDTLAELEALLGADCGRPQRQRRLPAADYEHLGGSTVSNIANSLWLDDSLTAREPFSPGAPPSTARGCTRPI